MVRVIYINNKCFEGSKDIARAPRRGRLMTVGAREILASIAFETCVCRRSVYVCGVDFIKEKDEEKKER